MSILTYSYTDPNGKEFISTNESPYDIDLSIVFKGENTNVDTNEQTEDLDDVESDNDVILDDPDDADDLDDDCQMGTIEDDVEFPEISDGDAPDVAPTPIAPGANPGIKYAPVVKPVKGNYNLYCIALVWNNDKGNSLGSVRSAGEQTGRIYKNLSNGNFNLNVIAKSIKVNFNHNAKNLAAAERQAKKLAVIGQKNKDPNLFIIVNHHAKGFSNGGGNTAHLMGTLTRDFLHELGHCRPLSLQHSGRVTTDGKFEAYGDGTSFMSKFSSLELTAAQLYTLGWLPENKVALYEFGFAPVEYKIARLSSSNNTGDAVKAVMIPIEGKKPLFLSMPRINNADVFTLHQPYGGHGAVGTGTKRLLVFGKTATYENLSFQKVSETKDYTVVRIGPAATKPTTPTPPTPPTPSMPPKPNTPPKPKP